MKILILIFNVKYNIVVDYYDIVIYKNLNINIVVTKAIFMRKEPFARRDLITEERKVGNNIVLRLILSAIITNDVTIECNIFH